MRLGWISGLAVALTLVLAACGSDAAEEATEAPAQEGAGVDGPPGTQGMAGMGGMSAMQMGPEMMAHMERMQMAGGDSLMQMVPEHRQMLDSMMSQMNREMEGKNMMADPQRSALADSLREDLQRMPQMSADDMRGFMPQHHGRVSRLMQMHGGMMGGM